MERGTWQKLIVRGSLIVLCFSWEGFDLVYMMSRRSQWIRNTKMEKEMETGLPQGKEGN